VSARRAKQGGADRAKSPSARARRSKTPLPVRQAKRSAATVVLTTAGSREEGDRIASALVEERLAACVNVVAPITSVYRWRGVVERAEEVLLIVKIRRTLMARVTARIRELHSYELPEVIALTIEGGSRDYLAWIGGETKTAGTTRRRTR
jgi:periplasmic divalent cation tolerance protein